MKQTFNILVVLLLCLPTLMLAQNNGQKRACGTDFTPAMETRLLQNIDIAKRSNFAVPSNRTITYVGINFHLVADANGNGRLSVSKVLETLCGLNQLYADQDIQFFIKDIFELNNNAIYTHNSTTAAQFQMSIRKNQNNNAINIFVCNNTGYVNDNPNDGIVLGYYSPTYDLIALRKADMVANAVTLGHEVGHFFSLAHPHNGWKDIDYHANYSASNPPPTTMQGVPVELADGSNCTTAGDYLCGTAADYNLGFGWNTCNYNNGAVDPTGALLDPDETLLMGYFLDGCQDRFSTDQKAIIAADLASFGRNYIKSTPAMTADVSATATLASPANNATTQFWDEVYLDWDDVPNANQYFLEVNRFSSFLSNGFIEGIVVTGSSHVLTNLTANQNYYWRVTPFNEVSTCAQASSNRKFRTSSFTVDTEEKFAKTSIKLVPNLTSAGQIVNLNIQTKETIDATIRIVNVNGQVMRNIDNVTFQTGTHTHQIETAGLAPGVYIINLQTANGQINERLMITN